MSDFWGFLGMLLIVLGTVGLVVLCILGGLWLAFKKDDYDER